jgi:hypothetical protein
MITTTHAKPPTQLHGSMLGTAVLRCDRCADVLGTAATEEQRAALRRNHHCRDMQVSRQPSIAVPFS